MIKIKALLIAPYVGLKELATKMAADQKELDVTVKQGDLEEAIPLARHAAAEGYELIISRGGTARMLRENTTLPVIEIPVSGYDILRTLLLVKDTNASMELIGFPNICKTVASVCELMDIHLPYNVIHQRDHVEGVIQEAHSKGVQIVIGDTVTIRTAKKYGLQGILITSGRESILEAFSNALLTHRIICAERAHSQTLESILNTLEEGFAIINQGGTLHFANHRFYEWTRIDPSSSELLAKIPELGAVLEDLQHLKETAHQFILNGELLELRGSIHEDEDLLPTGKVIVRLNLPGTIREAMSIIHAEPLVHAFTQLYAHSQEMKEAVEQAERSAEDDGCVTILGERGTEKRSFAEAIHSSRSLSKAKFIEIKMNRPSTVNFERLKDEINFNMEATLFIQSVDSLNQAQQRMLLSIIHRGRVKPIFALSTHPERLLAEGTLDVELYEALIKRMIVLPPLRRRIEDLKQMVLIYLGIFNEKYGKQIVGFRSTVLNALVNYPWNRNVEELEQILDQFVQQTEGEYIEENVLSLLIDKSPINSGLIPINLNQPLDDIEREVIRRVLEGEQLNQSRAAERLGISRSTLWRKLKEGQKSETSN